MLSTRWWFALMSTPEILIFLIYMHRGQLLKRTETICEKSHTSSNQLENMITQHEGERGEENMFLSLNTQSHWVCLIKSKGGSSSSWQISFNWEALMVNSLRLLMWSKLKLIRKWTVERSAYFTYTEKNDCINAGKKTFLITLGFVSSFSIGGFPVNVCHFHHR